MAHKLLLADDSVTIQRVIELTFADEDVDVITVGDGQLAIERLETDPPDIVLADVDMPKRDGYEVAAYVKSRPKLAHIPVVLLTGAFEPIDQVRASAAGSSDVLAKPFEPQMVINRVKELLGKKRQNEEEPSDALPRQAMPAPPVPQSVAQIAKAAPANGQATDEGDSLSLDDYFDQLDAAFSNLQPGALTAEAAHEEIDWAAAMAPAASGYAPLETNGAFAFAPGASAFAPSASASAPSAPADKPVDKPADIAIAPAASALVAHEPIAPVPPVADSVAPPMAAAAPEVPDAPIAPAAPISASPVATEVAPKPVTQRTTTNPFATLSAAKAEAVARPVAPVITDEVIDEVVSRVLQRLSDKVVRETVTAIVSETAERLVQEEIERIKNAGS
jgi:CheY-like chemotaxis protein